MLKRTGILVALAAALSLAAMAPAMAKDVKVGVVVKIGGIPWFNAMEAGIKAKSKELGDDGFMVGPTSADPALQVRAIEDLIAQGVNVIGVVPNDANGARAGAEEGPRRRHQGHHARIARPEERRLGLRNGLGGGLRRSACQAACAEKMGGKGKYVVYVGSLTVPLHNAWADCRDRLSQEELSRHDRWSATATALPKVPTTAARRRSTCWPPIPISAVS